jgi:hypothetical protein
MKAFLSMFLLASPLLAQTSPAPPVPPPVEHREAKEVLTIQAADFTGQTTLYSIGNPTDDEQLSLELINRARANPTAEGIMLATSTHPDVLVAVGPAPGGFAVNLNMLKNEFAVLQVRPPLAMNAQLTGAARLHSQFLFDTATQTHTGSGGSTIGQRALAAGYSFDSVGENVFSTGKDTFFSHAGFQIDWGPDNPPDTDGMQAGRGHRVNIHGDFREIGIGIVTGTNTVGGNTVGPQVITQDLGVGSPNNQAFVTGVAYYDLNGNSFYDLGEGIGGLTVNVDGSSFHAVTANSGGYTVPVPTTDATRAVTFSGLGASGDASAQIVGGANVKVDFIPAYVPPSLSGPAAMGALLTTNLTHNTVPGASGYKARTIANLNALADEADNLTRVTVVKSGVYSSTSTTVKHSGTGAYRMANPGAGTQTLTYTNAFHVKAGASLSFRSRLGFATSDQIARVEISTDSGSTWSAVFTQAGTGGAGELTFQSQNVDLAAFAGKDIRLRFNYSFFSGSLFNQTDDGVGWYIDAISFANLVNLDGATTTTLVDNGLFPFTPLVTGDFLLAVSPIISGRDFGFGPTKAVTVTASPPSLAEITVELTGGAELNDGSSTVNFGTKQLNQSEVRSLTVTNDGTEDLTGLTLSVIGAQASEFVTSVLGGTTLVPTASTTFNVTFTPTASGARAATLRITSNDSNENPFDISLAGSGTNAPTINVPPVAVIQEEGKLASLTVAATHPTLTPTFQWKKNGTNIKGATTATLAFSAVKLTDGGNFSVVVSAAGESVESVPVVLAVVKPVTQLLVQFAGTTVKPTVTVSGAATLTWKKTSGAPPVIETLAETLKTLTLDTLDVATDSGVYTCEASVPSSTLIAGTFDVRVFNAKPQVTQAQNMPDGAVGSEYTHQIKLNGGLSESPASYSAKTLPTGVLLNTKTGLISGVPTEAKDYKIIVTATNSAGSTSSAEETITIAPLPAGVVGSFTGTVAREAALNGGLGGRVDFTIASTGVVSGSFLLGTAKVPFKGSIVIDSVPPLAPPTATITIPRTGKTTLTFEFTLDPAANKLATGTSTLDDPTHSAAVEGWRHVWKATGTPPLNLATALPKLFTFALRPPVAPLTMPRGDGFGSFTLAKDGKLTLAGKTGDGESYTCATFAGPQGQILLFQTLVSKGSLLGELDIDLLDSGNLDSNVLGGTASWLRPANTKSRTYPSGYGPETITAVGALFTPPVAPALILGMTVGVDKAQLLFTAGGLPSDIDPDVDEFDILAGNKAKLPALLSAGNPGSVKLTSLSATTGLFGGSFIVEDDDLRAAFAGKKFKRTATFSGILTHDGVSPIGAGHFLLPELPQDADLGAMPPVTATTPTTSAILSGAVLLEKK